jgi:malate dehydrogenase (oxaloacetate-decarboxylating)
MTPGGVHPEVEPGGAMSPAAAASLSPALAVHPSASYGITMRVRQRQRPGAFAGVAVAIGETGAILGAIDLVRAEHGEVVRDVTVACVNAAHAEAVAEAVGKLDGVTVERVSDRTFLVHLGGKIEVNGTIPVKTRDDLSMAYTPGVARVSLAIHEDIDKAWSLTIKGNTVAVVSDGTAVLGLGDIGPEAAMPVMEGKALLFKEFAGVDVRHGGGAHVWRDQPGGHLGATLLRDRAAPARGTRYSRLP